ncbi:MAG: NAD-dependent epimerase/dehydratase family protein, partial [Myxococcales bacterium]|nr:NAD-dependent epimerase/dehydratase family protein [Myxococcales bacterium]
MSRIRDKRVMVTGGAGFLGSHVVELVKERGAASVIVPRSSEHDLTDMAQTRQLFECTRPDLVFHLAAQVGGIGANRDNPGRFFYSNMAMGLNVLEAARSFGTAKL